MNDEFTNKMNSEDETIAQKLDRVANQTNINAQFASELEERLRMAHPPKVSWFASSFRQVSPALRWVGLVILLVLILSWSIRTLIPAPQPAINNTPVNPDIATPTPAVSPDETATPISQDGGYDWRGSKLYLAAPLPDSPAQANVSLLKEEPPADIDTARALASQFGVQGKIFEAPGRLPGTTSFMVTDGKQRLYVRSSLNYDYYADYGAYSYMSGGRDISEEQAATVIDAFMKSHGLNFAYELENPQINPGMYYVLPLTPDGLPVYHNYNMPARLEFTIDEKEQVVLMASYQISYAAGGPYGIRTVEEAFQQVLDQSNAIQNGVLEIARSAGISDAGFWSRTYPDNKTITIYTQPTSYPATEPGSAPFISIGQYTAIGNTLGIESVDSSTYIEATGQFITENGIRKFNVDSWKVTDATEAAFSGNLRREGTQIILTADDGSGEYVIDEAPADLPLNTTVPDAYLAVYGFLSEGKLNWNSIQYYPAGSGGGGGGGSGTGFYRLNLSDTPVPFPSPTPQPESSQGNVEYIIREGDTLMAIAGAHGITPEKIVQANDWLSEEHVLMPGKRLIIPDVRVNVGSSEYIVQENDTLASIALDFGVTVDELIQANDIVDNLIFVGQTLIIPGTQLQAQNPLIGKRFEDQRGIFITNIYRKPDGSEHSEYSFITIKDEEYYNFVLEGDGLPELEKYHNRPINIWGTIQQVDQYNRITFLVEKYEIPFPDLQIELFQGTQENVSINGQTVTMFTTADGQKYVLFSPIGDLDQTTVDPERPLLLLEAMAIPGETFEGYPTLRYFNGGLAVDPITGEPAEFSVTADQPYVMDEAPIVENYVPPALTIEKVELVYYVPDPLYGTPDPNAGAGPQYIQPAWRFYGHYANGDEVEFLVQALKQEYLLPELAPYTPPG